MNDLIKLKIMIRENDCPFFTDEELEFYFSENKGDLKSTAYQCLLVKSEDTTLTIGSMQCADTSRYFRRLAQRYRKNNSGILAGG